MKDSQLDQMDAAATEAAAIMKALSNPARLRLLCALVPQDRSVSDLIEILDAPQAYVSNQLARLRVDGLVTCDREGRTITYRLRDDRVRPVLERLYEVFCSED
ncbi:MAG: metalloregulator ArsR/SmtB family transcription factor [Paracoccaceae bacterium]|nr:metalloregulator ArsR/SmtB family transcription factor [Paracoccaceae bacterium]MDG1802066.1 metalloregulator ArsR/SmtB family transcription factor [Paracoccaceae bacterium]MDG2452239.1 metalloregulator ArsR/SmtB family transcription factor [Paracoccaceae bacterium]